MKKLIYILCIVTSFFCADNAICQHNTLNIYTSYARGMQDKRYDFLYGHYSTSVINSVIYNNKNSTPDDEYAVGVGYTFNIYKRLLIGMDIGYARLVQDYRIPVNLNLYFHPGFKPFVMRDKSIYSMLQMSPRIDFLIIDKRVKLGVNLQGVSNVSYHKHINPLNLNKYNKEYFATEVYPGVFLEYWRLKLNIGVRALHWKYRDDAIANNGLNPDRYNPFKMRFGLSYDVLR